MCACRRAKAGATAMASLARSHDVVTGLAIPLNRLSWIQTAYLIAEIIAIPLTGWLTQLLSLRRLFLVAIAGFTLASAGCAASGGFAVLILFRILQGFCGGAMIP